MPQVTFVQPDGSAVTVTVAAGASIMDAALDHHVPGIRAQCGGGCTCATCHCYVLQPIPSELPAPHRDELDMLDYVWQRRAESRLACQVRLTDTAGVTIVEVPERQA
jgi:ferredoxin, 2Fe-2S